MDNFKFAQLQPFSLAGAGAVIGATSITLKSFAAIDGTPLSMSNFGTIGFGTIEPGNNTQEEQICFTGVVQNANGTATLTGVSNVTFLYPYTRTSGLFTTHAGASSFIISNTSGFYDGMASKNDDATINGLWTFTQIPLIPITTPTLPAQVASKAYADSLAIAGAPNASTTVQGLVQEATVAQLNSGTSTGSTGAVLFGSPADFASSIYGLQLPTSGQKSALAGSVGTPGASNVYVTSTDTGVSTGVGSYAADTGSANTYVVALTPALTAYAAGQTVRFKAANANSGASTLNVNSLGAKSITKNGTSALVLGDISLNELVTVVYDGTQFQLQNADSVNALTTTKIYVSAAQVAVNNTSTDTNLVSTTIPGGTLGTSNAIRVKFYISALSSSANNNLNIFLKYGGTSGTIATFNTVVNSSKTGWVEAFLIATGSTSAQGADTFTEIVATSGLAILYYGPTGTGGTSIPYAKDSTVSQTLVISAQWNSTNGQVTAENFIIDIIK